MIVYDLEYWIGMLTFSTVCLALQIEEMKNSPFNFWDLFPHHYCLFISATQPDRVLVMQPSRSVNLNLD